MGLAHYIPTFEVLMVTTYYEFARLLYLGQLRRISRYWALFVPMPFYRGNPQT